MLSRLIFFLVAALGWSPLYRDPLAGGAAAFVPNRTSLAIMQLVFSYLTHKRKGWTLMDQQWMLEKLEEWYGRRISRSALNYNLAILREQGIIETVTRHKRDPRTREFVCQVTLYKLTKKLKRFFSGLANWFKRCGWVPTIKQLRMGFVPAVGAATSREEVFREYQRRRKEESLGVRGATG
ncbi:MAG TPA: hypothetical protein VI298_08600 [Geobacteraceae bacterium]